MSDLTLPTAVEDPVPSERDTDAWGLHDPAVPAPVAALLCLAAVLALAAVELVRNLGA